MPNETEDMFDLVYLQDSLNSLTDAIEAHVEFAAEALQESFRATPWLPDSMKPAPKPSPSRIPQIVRAPKGLFEASINWVNRHRAVTAASLAFVGTGAYIIWRHRRSDKVKRRAKRAKNGARTEVIVLIGSPHSSLTRALSLDLERRGFIIYIPVNSVSEEQIIQGEGRADIKALNMDVTSATAVQEGVQKLTNYLNTPHRTTADMSAHKQNLAAIIVVPAPSYPTGALVNLSSQDWSDALNTNLLMPFTLLHALLPLATSFGATMLFLTSTIVPALSTPLQGPESVVAGAMQKYISTLRKEVTSVNTVQIQLGDIDLGPSADARKQLVLSNGNSRAELTRLRLGERIVKGTPVRRLQNSVFDAIVRFKGRQGTIFVGSGSRSYYLIGQLVPQSIVGWMLGLSGDTSRRREKASSRETSTSTDGGDGWQKV